MFSYKKINSNKKLSYNKNRYLLSNNRKLLIILVITTIFMLIETIGGYFIGSLALLADAGHMLTDNIVLLISLVINFLTKKKPNNQYTFGYIRLTTITAFLNSIALILINLIIIIKAAKKLFNPQNINVFTMIIISSLGLLINIFSFYLLYNIKHKNLNLRSFTLHVLWDLLSSASTIAAACIIFYTKFLIIDPILSIIVSCLVLHSSYKLLHESLHELLEGSPKKLDLIKIQSEISFNIPEIINIDKIHIWQIGEKPLLILHVKADLRNKDYNNLLSKIKKFLAKNYKIENSTIQIKI